MAGVTLSPASVLAFSSSPCKLRTISQLPKFRRSLLPNSSRACGFWSQARPRQRSLAQIYQRERWGCQGQGNGMFSTSAGRRAGKNEGDERLEELSGKADQLPLPPTTPSSKPKTLSALTATLKTKIPALSHENIYNLPNLLTFSRLLATPAIGYLIVHDHHVYAFSLFLYAAISDLLDGWIARRWNLQTVVGSVVDPMADKALMTTVVTCLAINGTLSLPLATLILGRDLSLATAALYYRYASLPPPKSMARYWDFSLPSAEVHPTTVSKLNTFFQLALLGTTLCVSLLHDPVAMHSAAGEYLATVQGKLGGPEGVKTLVLGVSGTVAATTVWSGLSYAWMKDAVKILGENGELKRKQGRRGRMIVGGCFGSVIAVAAWLALEEASKERERQVEGQRDVEEGGARVPIKNRLTKAIQQEQDNMGSLKSKDGGK